jgi:flagellar hook-associated protein 3 FlgL
MVMRISTDSLFTANTNMLDQQQSSLMNTQLQISTGRSILTPADNPVGAAQALQITQIDAANNQYVTNAGVVNGAESLANGALQSATTLLQSIQTTAVSAGNGAYNNSNRQALATQLQTQFNQLIAVANSRDASGNFLFSGFKGTTQPFSDSPNGVQYNGDDGQAMLQVSPNLQLPTSVSGADIFMRVKNGNGTFQAQSASTNTGSGVISTGVVTNPSLYQGQSHNYEILFTSSNSFNVIDTTNGPPGVPAVDNSQNPPATLTNLTYTSGQAISFNGIQVNITGAPASGDTFTIAPSSNQSIFTSISNLINTLNNGVTTGNTASQTQYDQGINSAMNELANGLNSLLNAQAKLGASINTATAMTNLQTGLDTQYQQTLAGLTNVDYNKAISSLTQEETALSATQKSFLQVQGLSMFNYIQ